MGLGVFLTLNYHPNVPPTNATGTPQFRDITLQNIVSVGAKDGIALDGLPESIIQGVLRRLSAQV
jgi:hypothetical protein